MEKDTINSHGASKFLRQKFYNDSDKFKIYVCRNCGKRAVVNTKHGLYKCSRCVDNADIVKVNSSWVANGLLDTLHAMGVGVKLGINEHFAN